MLAARTRLRELLRVAHVLELRRSRTARAHRRASRARRRRRQASKLRSRRDGFWFPTLSSVDAERHGALADAQRAERDAARARVFGSASFAQRHEQVVPRRQLAVQFSRFSSSPAAAATRDRRQRRVAALAPGDVEVDRDVEEEQRDRAGASRARRRPLERSRCKRTLNSPTPNTLTDSDAETSMMK